MFSFSCRNWWIVRLCKHDAGYRCFFNYIISGTNTPTRTGNNKLSISADSIDNVATSTPHVDGRQRISKSILKKSDATSNDYNNDRDGDTEKLILDNASASSVCNEGFNQSPVLNLNAARFAKSGQILRSNNNVELQYTATEHNEETSVSRGLFGGALEGIALCSILVD